MIGGSLRRIIGGIACAGVFAWSAGCGSSPSVSSPTTPTPTPPPITLNGTYVGNAIDSSGPGTMTWRVTQSGNAVSGTVDAGTPSNASAFNGTFAGTLTGTSLTFTITIPAGGVSGQSTCTASINGSGTASSTGVTGTYSGSSACGGAFSGGQFTLTKR